MRPFCDIDSYQRRFGEVEDVEAVYELLMDATRKLAAECENHGIDWKHADDEYKDRLMQVCREMAKRAISMNDTDTEIPFGASQITTSVNSFSDQISFTSAGSSGYGDLYFTKSERAFLGFNRGHMFFVDSHCGRLHHGRHKHNKEVW